MYMVQHIPIYQPLVKKMDLKYYSKYYSLDII